MSICITPLSSQHAGLNLATETLIVQPPYDEVHQYYLVHICILHFLG